LQIISKEESTSPKTPSGDRSVPSNHSISASDDQEQLLNAAEGDTTSRGLYPPHADQDQLLAEAAVAKPLLGDLNGVSSLRTVQDSPIPPVEAPADSQTNVSPAQINHRVNDLSINPTFSLDLPPSPPLTPQSSNSTTDASPRLIGLNAKRSIVLGFKRILRRPPLKSDSDSSAEVPSHFHHSQGHLSLRTSSTAVNPVNKPPHEGTRHDTIEGNLDSFLATPPESPVRVKSRSNPIHEPPPKATCSHEAELRELRDQLANALHELQVAKDEILVYKNSSVQINKDMEGLIKDLSAMTKSRQLLVRHCERTSSELEIVRVDSRRLLTEKRGWQEHLDVMHHRVVQAERQMRCLDSLTKGRFEVRQDDVFGSSNRGKKSTSLPTDLSAEAVKLIVSLNVEIQHLATNIVDDHLERTGIRERRRLNSIVQKAKKILGEDLTQMLQAQARMKKSTFHHSLVPVVVLEVFLVHWCSDIIEGWYPKRRSFSDLLVELSVPTGAEPSIKSSEHVHHKRPSSF